MLRPVRISIIPACLVPARLKRAFGSGGLLLILNSDVAGVAREVATRAGVLFQMIVYYRN